MKPKIPFSTTIYDPILGTALLPLRKSIASALSKNKHARILDLCCGTGAQLRYLEEKDYINLHGLDLDPGMIAYAKEFSKSIRFYQEDASNTHFNQGDFDIVISSLALHDKDQALREAILTEASRLISKQGAIYVADFAFDGNSTRWGRFLISTVEFFAGDEHYANFREYTKRGGMPNVLPEGMFSMEEIDRVLHGTIAVWKLTRV